MAVQEALVEVPAAEAGEREEPGGVPAGLAGRKVFRAYDQGQVFLLPQSLLDWLPEDHLARFVSDVVDAVLDLSPILASYESERGAPPYDPWMMLKLLLYGYATGVLSSRKIARACEGDVAFRFLAANQQPDFRSIARFRQRHLAAVDALFVQVLLVAARAGMTKLGRVAVDGTKVRANASRRKAMSYARMSTREQELAAEIAELKEQAQALLAAAAETDAAEDAEHGADRRGDELPQQLARRESRLATIRAAKEALEVEAAEAAAERERDKARRTARRAAEREAAAAGSSEEDVEAAGAQAEAAVAGDAEVAAAAVQAAAAATPAPKAQRNFTDADSRIMKTSDGSFHQCYNAQAVVDCDSQLILASTLTNQAADCPHLPGLLDQVEAIFAAVPRQLLADAGYFSEDNVAACAARGVDALIATGRFRHNEPPPPAPRGPIPKDATVKQRMARKLATKPGRAAYARRKAVVEPVFGQQDTRQNARGLLLRGIGKARGERKLHDLAHNLLKLFAAGVQPAPMRP